jgi:hypothetical protein
METFNLRTDLARAEGRPGERTPEDFKNIKIQLASLMVYLGSELRENLKAGNPAIFDDLTIRENLRDMQALINEFIPFNKIKESEVKNENTGKRGFVL